MIQFNVDLPRIVLSEQNIYHIWNARQRYSVEALARRAENRKLYFDTKYPERKLVTLHG